MEPISKKSIPLVWPGKLFFFCLIYFGFCTALAFAHPPFIYGPQVFRSAEVDRMAQSAKLERWTNSRGANIGFKRLSPQQPAQGSVMMMYGNGSTATDSAYYADNIQEVAALDMYILEYPGYEDRPGNPSQKTLFAAGVEGLQMLPTNQPIYLVGESLGSGVACYLAGTYPGRIAGMILISPFNRLTSVADYHFPILPLLFLFGERFRSDVYLRNYHGKVGMSVDGRDVVVPEKFGLKLYESYGGPKKLWQFPEGGHCEIREPAADFWKDAIAFLENP